MCALVGVMICGTNAGAEVGRGRGMIGRGRWAYMLRSVAPCHSSEGVAAVQLERYGDGADPGGRGLLEVVHVVLCG